MELKMKMTITIPTMAMIAGRLLWIIWIRIRIKIKIKKSKRNQESAACAGKTSSRVVWGHNVEYRLDRVMGFDKKGMTGVSATVIDRRYNSWPEVRKIL
jgi:hypothetical protein